MCGEGRGEGNGEVWTGDTNGVECVAGERAEGEVLAPPCSSIN